MGKPAEILILTGNTDRCRLWVRQLTDYQTRLWQGCDRLPRGVQPDVIVTDAAVTPESLTEPGLRCRLAAGEIGLILIGTGAAADVQLPTDYAPRELQLACQLLTQIIRLRRERNRGQRTLRLVRELAFSDPLTGLPNRRAWEEELSRRTAVDQESSPECLALLDLDHFKSVNEHLGHSAGDEVLRSIGQQLAHEADQDCLVARLGGDEFGLLLNGRGTSDLHARLDRMRSAAHYESPQLRVTASVGYVTFIRSPSQNAEYDRLLSSADHALLNAKSQGRDRCVAAVHAS